MQKDKKIKAETALAITVIWWTFMYGISGLFILLVLS